MVSHRGRIAPERATLGDREQLAQRGAGLWRRSGCLLPGRRHGRYSIDAASSSMSASSMPSSKRLGRIARC
eukprot:8944450-Lingulodinium_polyedra.AAC.1